MSKHTPTPWKLFDKDHAIYSDDTFVTEIHPHTKKEDAEFIVLAVNCHDELVFALKTALEFIKIDPPQDDTAKVAYALLIETIQKAIKKAEGK